MDIFFGHPYKLNYGGRESYGTICGALTTLLCLVCLLAFFALHIKFIVFRYYQLGQSETGLQDSVISAVTTFDNNLLNQGYELNSNLFTVSIAVNEVKEYESAFLG